MREFLFLVSISMLLLFSIKIYYSVISIQKQIDSINIDLTYMFGDITNDKNTETN